MRELLPFPEHPFRYWVEFQVEDILGTELVDVGLNERLADIMPSAPFCQGIGNLLEPLNGFGGEEGGECAGHVDGLRSDAEVFTEKVFELVYEDLSILVGEWEVVSGVEQVSWKSESWTSTDNMRVCIPGAK